MDDTSELLRLCDELITGDIDFKTGTPAGKAHTVTCELKSRLALCVRKIHLSDKEQGFLGGIKLAGRGEYKDEPTYTPAYLLDLVVPMIERVANDPNPEPFHPDELAFATSQAEAQAPAVLTEDERSPLGEALDFLNTWNVPHQDGMDDTLAVIIRQYAEYYHAKQTAGLSGVDQVAIEEAKRKFGGHDPVVNRLVGIIDRLSPPSTPGNV